MLGSDGTASLLNDTVGYASTSEPPHKRRERVCTQYLSYVPQQRDRVRRGAASLHALRRVHLCVVLDVCSA